MRLYIISLSAVKPIDIVVKLRSVFLLLRNEEYGLFVPIQTSKALITLCGLSIAIEL